MCLIYRVTFPTIYIDAFGLWCCRRLLRVPWTAGRSNQSILKEISPEYSLAGLMMKLKLQYSGHLMWGTDSLEKKPWCWEGLKVGGEGDDRGWDSWMASLTWWTWVWVSSRSWWWTGKPGMLQSMGLQSQTWLSSWSDPFYFYGINCEVSSLIYFFFIYNFVLVLSFPLISLPVGLSIWLSF